MLLLNIELAYMWARFGTFCSTLQYFGKFPPELGTINSNV